MNIRPRYSTPLNEAYWYSGLNDFNSNNYVYGYDTTQLVDGDMSDESFNPWISNKAGFDSGRYAPTSGHGAFGVNRGHYNYTQGVEKLNYYRLFGQDILDLNGNFTDMGKAWAKAVDALIPQENHLARFYDENGNLRTSWKTTHTDAHGRAPREYKTLKEYVDAVRNDQILGARHNVFLNRGKRYFYKDINGIEHWVDPDLVSNYTVSKNPVRSNWNDDHTIYWDDYELIGPDTAGNNPKQGTDSVGNGTDALEGLGDPVIVGGQQSTPVRHYEPKDYSWIQQGLQKAFPNLLGAGRLIGNYINNNRVYGEALKAIKPDILDYYLTHRQIVGDEGSKLAYYRQAAAGESKAARTYTSDAERQMSYLMEAKRVGDELRNQGNLIDNLEIRRTSDESNQHQWANTLRVTEVTNANRKAINYAEALRHNLLSQKHAANWTSLDNYLQGIEYRARLKKEEEEALEKEIWALQELDAIENDTEYQEATKEYNDIVKKHTKDGITDWNDPEVLDATKAYKKAKRQVQLRSLRRRLAAFGKDGMKITYKKKDDLLYKVSRDAVDHFRKMSKISSDSYNRKRVKIEKLTPHPKPRRMLQGGVAPFTIYKPIALGGETSTQSSTSGASSGAGSKSSGKKSNDVYDVLKDLFGKIGDYGLQSDVNVLYQSLSNVLGRARAFGEDLDSDDLATMYLQSMLQINNIKLSLKAFEQARTHATNNDALDEFAVDEAGRLTVQDMESGKISYMSWDLVKNGINDGKKLNPLTNNQLLNIRAYDSNYAFEKGDRVLLDTVNRGIGINKIAEYIKLITPKPGDLELTIEGYTKKESLMIIRGLDLLKDAPSGSYKYSISTKNYTPELKQAMLSALNYVSRMLPKNMETIIRVHAEMKNTTPNELIASFILSLVSTDYKVSFTPTKEGKDGSGSSNGDGDAANSSALAFVLGEGPRELVEFNTGTSMAVKALAIKGTFQTTSGQNLSSGDTLKDAQKSMLGALIYWNKATFGGSKLNFGAYDHILLNSSEILGVDLPYTTNIQGNEVPDFQMLKRMELADDDILKLNIDPKDYNRINKIYLDHLLPPKYGKDGKLNGFNYKRFAAIQVTLDEASLENPGAILSDEVLLAGKTERELYVENMNKGNSSKKDKYKLSDDWLFWGGDKLYKGTIFVPYSEDISFATISAGKPLKANIPNNSATVQRMLYAPATLNYKAPDITLLQILNN